MRCSWDTDHIPKLEQVKALTRLCEQHGGWKAVGAELGVNPATVYQIVSGRLTSSGTRRGVGRKLREALEVRFPGWMGLASEIGTTGQTITPVYTGEAQIVSLPSRKMAPPKIGWEAIVETDALPSEFETELPDNAMAPDAPKGTRCIFVTRAEPAPGDWVLVLDADGELHCREFRALRGGRWEAHAMNSAYLPLDSDKDQLRVVAVFDGMRGRKALHT